MDCEVQSSRFNDFSSEFDDDDLEEDDFSSGEISINGQLVISGSPMMFSCSGGTFGRGIVFLPEDKEDGDEEDLTIDSICSGHGISLTNNPQNVEFQVVSFRIHEDKPKSKHVYYSLMVLRTDGIDSDRAVVERRYSDFYALYKALKKGYSKLLAGVNFPSKVIGQKSNLNPETIESRRRAFEFFLQQVYHHKEICHHDAFREFFYIPDLRQATESLKGGELMDSLKRLLNCLHLQVKLCDKVREIVATLGAIVVVYEGQGRFEEAERYATAGIELVQDDFTCCYTIPLLHKAAQLRWKLQIEKKTIEKHLSLVQRMSGIEVDHAFTLKELAVSRFDKKS